jgi:hypothetical protein
MLGGVEARGQRRSAPKPHPEVPRCEERLPDGTCLLVPGKLDELSNVLEWASARDHRAAAVQVDPDVGFTHGASLAVAGVAPPQVSGTR